VDNEFGRGPVGEVLGRIPAAPVGVIWRGRGTGKGRTGVGGVVPGGAAEVVEREVEFIGREQVGAAEDAVVAD
jgi:hypothetical protein